MYNFRSLGETPVKTKDNQWITIFTGIKPPQREEELTKFNPKTASYVLFIANRNPIDGVYITVDGDEKKTSLDKVVSFLHTAKQDPESVFAIHDLYRGEELSKRVLSLDEVVEANLIE